MKSKTVIRVAIGFAVVVVLFLIVVAMQSDDFQVTRSTTIDAPPQEVFEHVNDFHKWEAWSPWAKLDPNAKNTFEGPASGTGSIFSWDGNSEVGAGRMTLTESKPSEIVRIKLDFIRPFEDTSTTEFAFKPEGEKTLVIWNMFGKKNFICKSLGVLGIMNMDKMLGADFEKGLASMKTVVEDSSKKSAADESAKK